MTRGFNILIFLFFSFSVYSQEYIYKEFGFNDGLPSSQVYDIYQDKFGIIWFATDRGISCYNGYEFKNYGIQEGILNNVVLDFYPQVNGKVYCSTIDNKLFYFNDDFNGFIVYKYNKLLEQKLKNRMISSIYEDAKNNLHFTSGIMDGKLIISKTGSILENPKKTKNLPLKKYVSIKTLQNHQPLFNNSFSANEKAQLTFTTDVYADINVISLNSNQYFVIKDDNAVSVLNKEGTLKTLIKSEFRPLIIKPINNYSFFIGYLFGGGKIVDINGNVLENILDGKSISRMIVDNEGGYWFSTLYSGVFYVKDPKIKIYKNIMHETSINSLTKNKKHELYIGYDNGDLAKIDSKNHYTIENISNIKKRAFVEFDTLSNSLIVNAGDITFKNTANNLLNIKGHTTKVSEPFQNKLIISQPNRLTIIDHVQNTSEFINVNERVHDACFWRGFIYFSTPSGVFTYKNGVTSSLKEKNELFNNRIDDIDYNEKRNEIYFATLGSGIIVYNKNTDIIYTITKEDGLLNDLVNEIYIENKNEIWVCTNSGINKIHFNEKGNYTITGLKSSNGLLNDGINDVEVIDNVVWIASKKGLVSVPKNLFDNLKKRDCFPLRIKDFKVNDVSVSIKNLTHLTYKENRLEFFAEAVSFKESNDILYKYKLEGLDDKWYSSTNRKIVYSALPYGDYIFKIGVTTSLQNNHLTFLEIPISIKAPFWKRGWFLSLSVLVLSGVTFLFFKIRVLTYNKDIIRELLRLMVKKFKRKDNYFIFKEAGKDIRVRSESILYIKSAGNYIELVTETKTYLVRNKIGEFMQVTPDPLEYIRIHRSYIVRIDKVDAKTKTEVLINGMKLPVSTTFESELKKIIF